MSILNNRTFLIESKFWFMKANSRFYRNDDSHEDKRYTRCGISFNKAEMKDGDWIFVKTEMLPIFIKKYLPQIEKTFVLITGLSDYCFPSYLEKNNCDATPLIESPYLIAWFSTNYRGGYPKDKVYPIPYGTRAVNYDSLILKQDIIENKPNIVFSSFRTRNDKRRIYIAEIMGNNKCNFNSYTSLLNQSKYIICPMGCTPDTFRLWESVYFNSIPVIEYPDYLQRELLDKHGIQYIPIGKEIEVNEAGIKISREHQNNEYTWDTINLDTISYVYPNHSEKATSKYWIQFVKSIQEEKKKK